jgi:hypothetical protein
MTLVHYRLSGTFDPEERLEDACLWKALFDEYGDDIALVRDASEVLDGGILWGRSEGIAGPKVHTSIGSPKRTIRYWEDPEFLRRAGRSFFVGDLRSCEAEVDRIHANGVDAFIKSTRTKHFVCRIPREVGLMEGIGDMAYSFMDLPDCLMVQQWVPMRSEARFLIIDREIVTFSPVSPELTPLDAYLVSSGALPVDPALVEFAADAALDLADPDCCLDCAFVGEDAVIVELNPMHIGRLGLYACDVRALAAATRRLLPDFSPSPVSIP